MVQELERSSVAEGLVHARRRRRAQRGCHSNQDQWTAANSQVEAPWAAGIFSGFRMSGSLQARRATILNRESKDVLRPDVLGVNPASHGAVLSALYDGAPVREDRQLVRIEQALEQEFVGLHRPELLQTRFKRREV